MGMIGVALSGVALFNALDDAGRDAVAHEVQDRCSGHPERRGQHHYHGPSGCMKEASAANTLVGYALDGFGIYSMYDANGRELTNADLDECHGRTGKVLWDGRETTMYHYGMTREYPYTVGCFRGTPVRAQARFADGPGGGPGGGTQGGPPGDERRGGMGGGLVTGPAKAGPRQPPAEALAACAGQSTGAACRFTTPRGDPITGTCRAPGDVVACVPERR